MHDANRIPQGSQHKYFLPTPWEKGPVFAVGGLFQVGYLSGKDLLLVHSSQGRGLYDVLSGMRIARDNEEPMNSFDQTRLLATGFDASAGAVIHMAGLFGGGLPWTTLDGYRLEEEAPDWPLRRVLLNSPDGSRALAGESGVCEMRAFGFSETGLSFVIATSCEVMFFRRVQKNS